MRHRRRHLAVLSGAVLATFVGLVPISPAGAAPVTNACLSGATATYSDIAIAMAGTAAPDPVAAGDPLTLSSTTVHLEVPGTLFLAGYRIFLLNAGANTIPADGTVTIAASNTSEGTSSETVSLTPTVTITDPTPANRSSGDESAGPLSVDIPLSDTVWTPTSGTVEFTEASVVVDALINNVIPVTLTCEPGASSVDGTTFTPAPAPAFASAAVTGGASTTATTATTAPPSTSTTVAGSTTTTTAATTSTTAAPARYLPAGSATLAYDCKGADVASQGVLDTLGSLSNPPVPPPNHLSIDVKLDTDPIDSPAQGQTFQLPLRWTVQLPAAVVQAATGLGIQTVGVSGISLTAGPTAGASGADTTATPPDRTVTLAQSSGFTEGPVPATMTRTGGPGDPIVVTAKAMLLTATVDLGGTPLVISMACDPPASAGITLVDAAGTTPSTTATTAPSAAVLGAQASRSGDSLARTGLPALAQVGLAVVLLDLGYLAVSTRWSQRRRSMGT